MKKLLLVLAMVFMLPVTAMAGVLCVWKLTGIVTYSESGTCHKGSSAIPLPKGDKGDIGNQGIQGVPGIPAPTNFSAPPNYDRVYIEHNSNSAPNPPETMWVGSEAEYQLIHPEDDSGVGPRNLWMTSVYDPWVGWISYHYYKIVCIRANPEWFPAGTPFCP